MIHYRRIMMIRIKSTIYCFDVVVIDTTTTIVDVICMWIQML